MDPTPDPPHFRELTYVLVVVSFDVHTKHFTLSPRSQVATDALGGIYKANELYAP